MSVDTYTNSIQHMNPNVITIWLDAHVNTTEDCLETQKYLRRFFENLLVFDNKDLCYTYIDSTKTKKIFFIVSGSLGCVIVPTIHAFEQIEAIYIFCADKLLHEQWAKDYDKIRGIFSNSSFLLSKLCLNVTTRFNDSKSISIFNMTASKDKSTRNLKKQSTVFMWFQVLLEVLLRMPGTEQSKNEMLHFCRLMYENNSEELKKIDEFEDYYASSQAFFWYTRDSFLYRLMNRFMRSENIDKIYQFRYFIKDLHFALRRQYIEDVNSSEEYVRSSTVYRGQRMTAVELEELKENVHNLIAMNTFLSTTLSKRTALIYAGDHREYPYVEAVLFEIDIGTIDGIDTKPFANIAKHSNYEMEDEVLFSMGAIFQIDSVNPSLDGIWIVKLHLTSTENKQLTELSEYITKNIKEVTTLLDFGDVLLMMGEDDRAISYYKKFLKENSLDLKNISYVCTQLGHIYFKRGDYESALDNYTTALDEQTYSQPPNYLCLPQAYGNIGKTNEKLGHKNVALDYYQQQLKLYLQCKEPNHDLIRNVEQKINLLFHDSDELDDNELQYNKQKLDVYLENRPGNHPDLIKIYSNIGLTYGRLKNYQNALINYERSLEIALLSLPSNHDAIKIAYYNVAFCQCKIGDHKNALENYDKAIQLELSCESPKLLLVAKMCNSLGHVYLLRRDYRQAALYYNKAVQIWRSEPTHNSEYLQNLGNIYLKIDEYEEALKLLEEALCIEKNTSVPETQVIIELNISIGHCYFALKQYICAINSYQLAFKVYEYSLILKNNYNHNREFDITETLQQIVTSKCNTEEDAELVVRKCRQIIDIYFRHSDDIDEIDELIPAIDLSYDDHMITENYEHYIAACVKHNNIEDGFKICQKLIDVEQRYPSKKYETMAIIYTNASYFCYYLKNYSLANQYFEKSLELMMISTFLTRNSILISYINLGCVMCNAKRYKEVLRLFSKLLSIELARKQPSNVNITLMYFIIGLIYCGMKQYNTAITSFIKAIDTTAVCSIELADSFSMFFDDLQNTFFSDDDFDEAIECCMELMTFILAGKQGDLSSLAKLVLSNYEERRMIPVTKQTFGDSILPMCGQAKGGDVWYYILVSANQKVNLKTILSLTNININDFGEIVTFLTKNDESRKMFGFGKGAPIILQKWLAKQYDMNSFDKVPNLNYENDDIRFCIMQRSVSGQKVGISNRYWKQEQFHYLVLSSNLKSSLAKRVGIKNYDVVISLNGINVENYTVEQLITCLNTERYLPVEILVCSLATYRYYKANNKIIHCDLPTVQHLKPVYATSTSDSNTNEHVITFNEHIFYVIHLITINNISIIPQAAVFKSPQFTIINDICFVEIEERYYKGKIRYIGSYSECEQFIATTKIKTQDAMIFKRYGNDQIAVLEQLSNKILQYLFTFIDAHDLYDAFWGLNLRFNYLLQSCPNLSLTLNENIEQTSTKFYAPYIKRLTIEALVNSNFIEFFNIQQLILRNDNSEYIKQIQPSILGNLTHLSFLLESTCTVSSDLVTNIFSGGFRSLRYVILNQIDDSKIYLWSTAPSLRFVSIQTQTPRIIEDILMTCPNLDHLRLHILEGNKKNIFQISPLTYSLRRLTLCNHTIAMSLDDIDAYISCVPDIQSLYLQTEYEFLFIDLIKHLMTRLQSLTQFNCHVKELITNEKRLDDLCIIQKLHPILTSIQCIKEEEDYRIFASK